MVSRAAAGKAGFGELPGSGEVRPSPGMPLTQGPGSLVGPPLTQVWDGVLEWTTVCLTWHFKMSG